MYLVTLSSAPEAPSVGLGLMNPNNCLNGPVNFATTVFSDQLHILTLEEYPRGVEPLVGLIGRFLAHWPAQARPRASGRPSYASLSIHKGPSPKGAQLVEHLVATNNGALLEVELCDELDERRTVTVACRYTSQLDLVEHAIGALLWHGDEPGPLRSLTEVPVTGSGASARVLERDIPPYTRRRLQHWLGGFRGPTSDAFYAQDWADYLAAMTAPVATTTPAAMASPGRSVE